MQCPACQHPNPEGARFCNNCAHELGRGSPDRADGYRAAMPEELSQKILASRDRLLGSRLLVTVVFADIGGFAVMSGRMDPEASDTRPLVPTWRRCHKRKTPRRSVCNGAI